MPLSPRAALYGSDDRPLPALPPCVHYAGRERYLRKALALQAERGPVFDVAGDCEDGAPVGEERAHALMVAGLVNGADNRFGRMGVRVHDVTHPAWQQDVEILVGEAGERLAFITLPKVDRAADAERFIAFLEARAARAGVRRAIPLSLMIESPQGVHEAWAIAALPHVVSLDFGNLDFVSAHHGAIPMSAMESPGQFDHALVRRAKAAVASAALAHGVVPSHGLTRALDDPDAVYADARRARDELGFLRMWSIHPSQIDPIVRAMTPDRGEVEEAAEVLLAAQAADYAPIAVRERLHDRGSYRYCLTVLARARAAGVPLPSAARPWFDARDAAVSKVGGTARGGIA
jgi:citrate lyase subunit beta/citryl-CoA lyase